MIWNTNMKITTRSLLMFTFVWFSQTKIINALFLCWYILKCIHITYAVWTFLSHYRFVLIQCLVEYVNHIRDIYEYSILYLSLFIHLLVILLGMYVYFLHCFIIVYNIFINIIIIMPPSWPPSPTGYCWMLGIL